MGKKSKRRPASKGNKKKERRPKTDVAPSADGASWYGEMELMYQGQLLYAGRHFYGDGHMWTKHVDTLLGDSVDGDTLYEEQTEIEGGDRNADGFEEGSEDALRAALEQVWSDKKISDPHGAGLAMGPRQDWMEWALDMAKTPDRAEVYLRDYNNDKEMHKRTLERLSREEEGGFCGSLDYILAMNCILQDTFHRFGLSLFGLPPPLNLYQAMLMRMEEGQPLYKVRMEVWRGYEKLVLVMTSTVQQHPLIPKPEPPSSRYTRDPEPLNDRGEFLPLASVLRLEHEREEEEAEDYYGSLSWWAEDKASRE